MVLSDLHCQLFSLCIPGHPVTRSSPIDCSIWSDLTFLLKSLVLLEGLGRKVTAMLALWCCWPLQEKRLLVCLFLRTLGSTYHPRVFHTQTWPSVMKGLANISKHDFCIFLLPSFFFFILFVLFSLPVFLVIRSTSIYWEFTLKRAPLGISGEPEVT